MKKKNTKKIKIKIIKHKITFANTSLILQNILIEAGNYLSHNIL